MLKRGSDGADWVEDGVDILTEFPGLEKWLQGYSRREDKGQLVCGFCGGSGSRLYRI